MQMQSNISADNLLQESPTSINLTAVDDPGSPTKQRTLRTEHSDLAPQDSDPFVDKSTVWRRRASKDTTKPSLLAIGRNSSGTRTHQRRNLLDSEQYKRSIVAHSNRVLTNSIFPGNNYVDLANWLLLKYPGCPSHALTDPHVLAILYDLEPVPVKSPQCFNAENLSTFTTIPQSPRGKNQLLFVRGFLSPAWLAAIGSKFEIDPEFFLRHLDFFASSDHRHSYSFPSLPSTSSNMIKLCVSTIIQRDGLLDLDGPNTLSALQQKQEEELSTYRRQLRTRTASGDSLVREFSTISDRHSIVEQWISITIAKNGEGWLALVWLDQGKDLAHSPKGPWIDPLNMRAITHPVIQHHPKMTSRNTYRVDGQFDPTHNDLATAAVVSDFPQSGTLLPLEYDSLLALADLSRRASSIPILSLIPLFVHAAFSEVQILNLVEQQVIYESTVSPQNYSSSLQNLKYLSKIGRRHRLNLENSIQAIQTLFKTQLGHPESSRRIGRSPKLAADGSEAGEGSPGWSALNASSGTGTFTVDGIARDYEELLTRSQKILDTCASEMQIIVNIAMVAESHKAIEQAERMKKLTLLATFFIPLSFSASILGMNLEELGQGTAPYWWYIVLSIPLTIVAQAVYLWNTSTVSAFWRKRVLKKRTPA